MSKSDNLRKAKEEKDGEYYTQREDIQKEMNVYIEYNPDVFRGKTILLPCDDPERSNFTKFFALHFEEYGIKKLISTSYAYSKKLEKYPNLKTYQPTLFETQSPKYDEEKSKKRGKIFILDEDTNKNGVIDIDDLKRDYLESDGDFRSDEVKKLRDESDIIITNPPFSLFREFMARIFEASKKCCIIGNKNGIAYKNVLPLIMKKRIWLGVNDVKIFEMPNGSTKKFGNICWFTNIDHGRRHCSLELMSMNDNLKYNQKLKKELIELYGDDGRYPEYSNFNGIDIPILNAIPSDYDGIMGVPITFLDRYNPEQFEILGGGTGNNAKKIGIRKNHRGRTDLATIDKNGNGYCPYNRILIRKKR